MAPRTGKIPQPIAGHEIWNGDNAGRDQQIHVRFAKPWRHFHNQYGGNDKREVEQSDEPLHALIAAPRRSLRQISLEHKRLRVSTGLFRQQKFQYFIRVRIECSRGPPTEVSIKPIRSVIGILRTAQKQTPESAGPQTLHDMRQERLADAATLVIGQQCQHLNFTRMPVPVAVADNPAPVHAYEPDDVRFRDALGPGLHRDAIGSETPGGDRVLAGLAAKLDASGSVRGNSRSVMKGCHSSLR
jgi:hypothetical protein